MDVSVLKDQSQTTLAVSIPPTQMTQITEPYIPVEEEEFNERDFIDK